MDHDECSGGRATRLLPLGLMAVGAVSLLRSSGLLCLSAVGLVAYDLACAADRDRRRRTGTVAERRSADRKVDIAMEDSFPASDPPGFSGAVAGSS